MRILLYFVLITTLTVSFFSCEREYEYANNPNGFSFSTDTLMFDTIFSSIGSITKNFKIYNTQNEDLIINSIELAKGEFSEFRININGYSNDKVENVKINALDSLFIFVDITIEPENTNSPFVVNDSVIITTGDKKQDVKLVAYGQDVVLLKQEKLKTTTFTNEKPYLIYDFIAIDSLETLTIEPGARLHFYNNASLFVFGSLQAKGSIDAPIKFMGHRLDEWYLDKPGQWGHIHFMPSSKDNEISYAEITNSTMGLFVDSVGIGTDKPLVIDNCIINHVTEFGLITQNSKVNVSNSVFGDCGIHSIALTLGGTYNFYHCTVANFYQWNSRSTPAVFLNNFYTNDEGTEVLSPLTKANFYNSIIYGSKYEEIGFSFSTKKDLKTDDYNYLFNNCLIKSGSIDISSTANYKDIISNEDPNFIDAYNFNYQLDTLSPCKDIADKDIAELYKLDILGADRLKDKGPDLGAYERIENE